MAKKSEPPVMEFKSRGVKAAIWEKPKKTKGGRKYMEYSVQITKSYRDDDENWHTTDHYFPVDLPHLALVTSKAFEYVSLKTDKE